MIRRMNTKQKLLLGLLGGSSAAFSPLSLSGLALWLDASDASTLFQDSGGTTPATADNDVVGYWGDKSGNGRHATQGTTADKPVLKLGIQNGKNVLRADSTDVLTFSGSALDMFRNKAYGYMFAVHAAKRTTIGVDYLLDATNGTGSGGRFSLREGSAANKYTALARRVDADSAVTFDSNTNHGGLPVVVAMMAEWAAGTLKLRQNGTQVGSGSFAASGNTSDTASTVINSISYGDTSEVLVYTPSEAFTAAQITQIEAYLNTKWAVY